MKKGDIIYAYIPFRFRKRTYYKFREVKITGIGGNGNLNVVPVSEKHSFAECFKKEQLSTDKEFCLSHNLKVDEKIREFENLPIDYVFS